MKNACFIQGKESEFEPWLVIYDNIVRICTDISGAPSPSTTDPQTQPLDTHPPIPPGTTTDHPTSPTGQNTTDPQQDLTFPDQDLTDPQQDLINLQQDLQVQHQAQVPLDQVEGQAEQVMVTLMPGQ